MATVANSRLEMAFVDLPIEVVSHILTFLTYEQLSFVRSVSKKLNLLSRSHLNTAFFRLGEQLEVAMGNVKKMLPKRESQRRNHSLSRVNEVYSALETRYALLGMTFRKHIDDDSCCFIAGKVLDEAFSVLYTLNGCVRRNEQPREAQELLRDIRDYSSMAMEYFDEQIAPTLRTKDPLSALYRSHGRYSSFPIALPRTAPAGINASLRSLYPSPYSSTTASTSGSSEGLLSEMSKFLEWRRDVEEKLRRQEKAIREQSAAINSIIGSVHQVCAKISFNCSTDLKTLGEMKSLSTKLEEACSSSSIKLEEPGAIAVKLEEPEPIVVKLEESDMTGSIPKITRKRRNQDSAGPSCKITTSSVPETYK